MKRVFNAGRKLGRSRFFKDSVMLQFSGALVTGMQLLTSILLAHSLGDSKQGLFVSAGKIYGLYFMLLNVGILPTVVSQIGAAVTRNQKDKVAAWQGYLLKTYLLIGTLLLALGWFLLPPIAGYLFEDPRLGVWASWLCVSPILEAGRNLAQATFQGTRRMRDLARLEVGAELLRLGLLTGAMTYSRTPVAAILATLLASALGSLLGIYLYRRSSSAGPIRLPGLRVILQQMRQVPLRVGLPLGFRLGFLRSLDAMAFDIFPPLFLLYAGVSQGLDSTAASWVAYMNVAQNIMKLPMVMLSGMAKVTLPALSGVAGKRDPEGFRKGVLRVTFFGGGITILSVLFVLLVLPLAVLIYPPEYARPVAILAGILALGHVFKGFTAGFDAFFLVADRLRVAMLFSGVGMLFTFPISYWLSMRIPHTGAAWGVVATYFFGLPHVAYIAWFFSTHQHLKLFQTSANTAQVKSAPDVSPSSTPPAG